MATVEEIERKTYKYAMQCDSTFYLHLCPTYSDISEVPLLSVARSDDYEYQSDQCVILDDVQFSRSLSIPVTITENISGSTLLDKVIIYVNDYNTGTVYSTNIWNCGRVNGSSSNTMTINLPTDMYNNTYYMAVYIGKTGANRYFTFTAHYQTFTITKKFNNVKEVTWHGEGTVSTNGYSVPTKGGLNVNYPLLVEPDASILGGLGVEKLQKITITISNS